jgi:hypothetical protein
MLIEDPPTPAGEYPFDSALSKVPILAAKNAARVGHPAVRYNPISVD